jgi:hypothetical protein
MLANFAINRETKKESQSTSSRWENINFNTDFQS